MLRKYNKHLLCLIKKRIYKNKFPKHKKVYPYVKFPAKSKFYIRFSKGHVTWREIQNL